MEQVKNEIPDSQSCGPDCSCNTKKGLPLSLKIIILVVIILVAGSVLADSLLKKSHNPANKQETSYSSALASSANQLSASQLQKKDSTGSDSAKPVASLAILVSFSSLDTVANQYDGVIVLVENKADDKSASRMNEISQAAKSIGSRGMNFGTFQLSQSSPDIQMIRSQITPPCALILVKGRGMRGVDSSNINQQKLLQACLAAMQPTSCCPAGGKKVCK
jgi:hypothetical protein